MFIDIDVMIFLDCLDQLLVVFEFAAAGGSVNFFSGVTFLLIRNSGRVACLDYREVGVRMMHMHVFDNIFTGHS